MKATRHNGRSGKHGTYDAKHNDRRFDVENSEHIDAERTKFNVYWDCYQGYSLPNDENKRARFTFSEVEKAYYVENYSDHVDGQNERNRKARHYDRVKSIDGILENNKTCPEETLLQLGNIDGTVSADVLAQISAEYFEEFNKRYGSHVHILDWALHLDGGRLPVHVRCLIDEAANIGQIPNLVKLVATIRSREISACLVLQAQSQLKAIYKDNSDTIIGNMDSRIFLGGSEPTTLKELNQALGKETIDTYNTSNTRGNSPSYGMNYQKLGKDLATVDELAVLDGGKCILQLRGVRPFLSDKYDLTQHPNYKYTSDYDKCSCRTWTLMQASLPLLLTAI